MTLHTSRRSKKLWLPCHTKPLQPAPAIADDVKLQPNKNVFWMDKIQMWCVKKKGRNIRIQSATVVVQRPESDFCFSSTKQEKSIQDWGYIMEL